MNRIVGGIVGLTGFIGRHHLSAARSIISPCVDIVACVPSSPENWDRGRAVAEQMGFSEPEIYPTLEEMLKENHSLDFVLIATPNHLHLEQCLMVAESGYALVCDKPLARDGEEARKIVEAVQAAEIPSCVTATYCGHAANIEARHRIRESGRSLEICGGTFRYDQRWLRKPLSEISSEEGKKQAEWRKDPKRSGAGGAAGDILSHLVHQVLFITGLKVVAVQARRRFVVEGATAGMTDDEVVAVLFLENGAEVTCKATQYTGGHQNDNEWELNLGGGVSYGWSQRESEFLWTSEGGPRTLLTRDDFQSPILAATNTMPALHVDGWHDAHARLLTSFAWSVLEETPPDVECFHPTVEDGANVNAVIDAVIESADAGGSFGKVALSDERIEARVPA